MVRRLNSPGGSFIPRRRDDENPEIPGAWIEVGRAGAATTEPVARKAARAPASCAAPTHAVLRPGLPEGFALGTRDRRRQPGERQTNAVEPRMTWKGVRSMLLRSRKCLGCAIV